MKTRSAKNKGKRLQVEVAKRIREVFDITEDHLKSNPLNYMGEDVIMTNEAREKFPYSIECKNTEKINIWQAINQCIKNAGKYTPLVCFSRNREDIYVVMKFEDFLKVAKGTNK